MSIIEKLKTIMAARVVTTVTISLLTLSYTISSILAYNSLNCDYQGYCLCPDDALTLNFLCSVSDGAATVWKGSIFSCPNSQNEILLRHSRFEDGPGISGTCNDGAVIVYSIESTNNSYISQLNVTVSPEMQNGTIECIQDGPGANATSIGACPFKLTFASESPDDAHFSYISPNQFTIEWSPPANNCPLITYDIATTDCGQCPSTISSTSITCTNLTINGQICSIVIQTRACGNHSDTDTANLTIELRVPGAPEVTARWINQFTSILTSFNETEQLFISDGFDGSATNYTITYSVSDSTSERKFDSVTIPASACTQQICAHTLKIDQSSPCLLLSGGVSITVTVFATNVLGEGPISDPVVLIIPEQDDDRKISGVTLILIATILIIILLVVSAVSVLIIMVIVLLRRNLQIKKELVKAKESSTYEEIDISAPASSIDTAENISYSSVSRKYKHASSTHAQCH